MDLYYIVLVLFLLVLILVTFCLENKTVMYFIIILFLCLLIHKIILRNKETFVDKDETQATDTIMSAVLKEREIDGLKNQVSNLEKDIKDLSEVLRLKTINMTIDKTGKAENFDLLASQKEQDHELQALENELDVLLKLYRKETELNDAKKYHSLPVFSSCRNVEEGLKYLREDNGVDTLDSHLGKVAIAENQELMKNLGIDSKSSAELMTIMEKGTFNDNIDFNINLV